MYSHAHINITTSVDPLVGIIMQRTTALQWYVSCMLIQSHRKVNLKGQF